MGETRRTTRFIRMAALCATAIVSAAGCTTDFASTPTETAGSVATSSEAAVLAPALDVYTRYSAALDAVLARGDGDYSQLEPFTTPEFLDRLSGDSMFATNGWVTTGSTSFDTEEVVAITDTSVEVRLCRDVSRVRVVDDAGVDVTPDDRDERFIVTVTFLKVSSDTDYLIDSSVRDAEDQSCAK